MSSGTFRHDFSKTPHRLEAYLIGSIYRSGIDMIRKKLGGQIIEHDPENETMGVRTKVRPMNPRRMENIYGDGDGVSVIDRNISNVVELFDAHRPLHSMHTTEARMAANELIQLLKDNPEILCPYKRELELADILRSEETINMIEAYLTGSDYSEIAEWAYPTKEPAIAKDAVRKRIKRALAKLVYYLVENDSEFVE